MPHSLSIRLLQMNAQVGDVDGNTEQILAAMEAAKAAGVDVLVTPELALTGYPPEDLLLRPAMMQQVAVALERIRAASTGLSVCVGAPQAIPASEPDPWPLGAVTAGPPRLYNSALVYADGVCASEYHKQALPNYQVFDERRYFEPGARVSVFTVRGRRLSLLICEDVWVPELVRHACEPSVDCLLVLNASPFAEGKIQERLNHVQHRALSNGCAIAYVNMVGAQDELVFDGGSFVMDANGEPVAQAAFFAEGHLDFTLTGKTVSAQTLCEVPSADEALYRALVLGVSDYFKKTGFQRALLGLSGGIDSALTLAIAVEALGADRVHAVMMPYRYTADISVEDAKRQAEGLGCEFSVVSIESMVDDFMSVLAPFFVGHPVDTTEENLQSRCRGVLLMALSNKTGALVLTTGNKSEMAVGYATLYGDMAGGFAVLKDVWKTRVYDLARHVNRVHEIIPERVIVRPPSAELAPDQQDADSLPPYDVLDAMLRRYIEDDWAPEDIIAAGFDPTDVMRMCRLVDINEYKRRQAAVGPRVTVRGFGRDRRYPIAHRFKA